MFLFLFGIQFDQTSTLFLCTVTGPVFFAANGHYYELISNLLGFNDALVAASQKTHNALPGHLATITTQEEYDFVVATFVDLFYVWIGGSDDAAEGTFYWVTGPEAGLPVDMTNGMWASGQPDDGGNNEDCMMFWNENRFNDLGCVGVFLRYLVEYEGTLRIG